MSGYAAMINKAVFVLRVARPTDQLAAIQRFYQGGLGFELLAQFDNHNGFDGLILGHRQWPYHLEFTHHRGHTVGKAPSKDNLLVLYFPSENAWRQRVEQMRAHGFEPITSYNPYWDERGVTFEDADGYRVVLQQAVWAL